ncbi:hypothetical protein CJJ07_003500 [Candidozyma auris]|nr:hypothetical protein CJJ07_003500 [[Candida] auris]
MNFNKGARNPNQGNAQFPAGRQRAMLPPQFQHLSPQQLQELENTPQFQNAMRQYYQKQQMMQQQMLRQQQAGMGQGMMAQQLQGHPGQNLASANQRLMNRNIPPGFIPGGQSAQQQLQAQRANLQAQAQMQGQGAMTGPPGMPGNGMPGPQGMGSGAASPPNYANMQKMGGQYSSQANAQMRLPMGTQPGSGRGSIYGGATGGANDAPVGAIGGAPGANAMSGMSTIPGPMAGALPVGGQPGANQSNAAGQPQLPNTKLMRFGNNEELDFPPGFGPDALNKIPLKQLSSTDEWSQKLKSEGKDVPLDIKVYEDIIKKDTAHLRNSQLQAKKNKTMLEKIARDIKTYNTIKQLRMNAINASDKNQYNNSIWGEGYSGYGNGISNTSTQVILPQHNKPFSKVPDIGLTDRQLNEAILRGLKSGKRKPLVPIRLEFDQERDRFKLRDTFLWDLSDETYPIENFIRTLIEDYKFIPESHFHSIMSSVNEQIKDYKQMVENPMGELRVPIKIDLVINNTQFTDQFEWDILSSNENDPEEFATILCDEMSLPGEFATAVAFSIREQTQLYHKALFLVGYGFDGSFVREDEIRSHLLPPLRVLNTVEVGEPVDDFISTLRNPALVADYSPSLTRLAQLEVEKIDKEMERESRRRRRHTNTEFSYNENGTSMGASRGTASRRSGLHSGRGVKTTLPDLSEIPKTFRTPMPSSVLPGGIDLGVPEIYGYNELIVNRTQIRNPDYKPPHNPDMVTSRREGNSVFVKIKFPQRINV